MKEPYRWNYDIKVKTKDGEFVYEDEPLDRVGELAELFPDNEGISAQKREKPKTMVKKRTPKNGKG